LRRLLLSQFGEAGQLLAAWKADVVYKTWKSLVCCCKHDPNWTTIICFRIASLLIFRKRIQISASILAFSFRFLPSTFENDHFSFFIYSFYHCLCKKSYKNTRKNFKEKDVNSLRLLGIVLALQSQR
jgi:hypothetical protein